jgi:hypothetical protein
VDKLPSFGSLLRGAVQTQAEAEALDLSIESFLALIASDAAAVRRIVTSPSSAGWSSASPAARGHLREMLQEHLAALDGNTRQVAALLQSSAQPPTESPEFTGDWRGQAGELANAAAELAARKPPETLAAAARSWLLLSAQARRAKEAVTGFFPAPETASAAH